MSLLDLYQTFNKQSGAELRPHRGSRAVTIYCKAAVKHYSPFGWCCSVPHTDRSTSHLPAQEPEWLTHSSLIVRDDIVLEDYWLSGDHISINTPDGRLNPSSSVYYWLEIKTINLPTYCQFMLLILWWAIAQHLKANTRIGSRITGRPDQTSGIILHSIIVQPKHRL